MQFLRFLEKLRNPFFDFFFSLVTRIGEETVFLVIAIFIFWCINKREGYYVLICGLVGTLVNQVLKLACRIPRPWDKNPSFTIVESARPAATAHACYAKTWLKKKINPQAGMLSTPVSSVVWSGVGPEGRRSRTRVPGPPACLHRCWGATPLVFPYKGSSGVTVPHPLGAHPREATKLWTVTWPLCSARSH